MSTTVEMRPSTFLGGFTHVECERCGASGGTTDPGGWAERHAEMHDRMDSLPASAMSVATDATAAGFRVNLYATSDVVSLHITDADDGDWWTAYWRLRDGSWRYWYTTNGDKENMTLRELRTWVTDRHHLSRG